MRISRQKLNELEPTVWVGKNGLTPNLKREIKLQIETKGYIKGKILKSIRNEFESILNQILTDSNAELVDRKGLTFILAKKEE